MNADDLGGNPDSDSGTGVRACASDWLPPSSLRKNNFASRIGRADSGRSRGSGLGLSDGSQVIVTENIFASTQTRTNRSAPRGLIWSIGSRPFVCASLASAAVLLLIYLVPLLYPLHSAEVALTSGDFATALLQADKELRQNPNSSQALLIAGVAAQGIHQPEVAARYFARVPDDGDVNSIRALVALSAQALSDGRANDAERFLRRALEIDPNHAEATDRLIFLLVLEGRNWETYDFILRALRSGRVEWNHLIVIGSNKTQLDESGKFSSACLNAVPSDPLPLLPEARTAFRLQNVKSARQLAERIVAARPEVLEAQGLLGTILAEAADPALFLIWHKRLPSDADRDPAVWYSRGVWALKTGQVEGAVRCFAESLLLNPNAVGPNHQLSLALASLQHEDWAVEIGERVRDLARLDTLVRQLTTPPDVTQIREIVGLQEKLGRYWEAAAWCHIVGSHLFTEKWPTETALRLRRSLEASPLATIASANPAYKYDLTKYPLPDWNFSKSESRPVPEISAEYPVSFTDDATAANLSFTYRNGAVENLESMFELDGGGVAVLDFDQDGWSDLYLTQGGSLPPPVNRIDQDMLYRNLGNGRFEPVTVPSRTGDRGYSQGVTVGDFDNDGFPDLVVANIGPNTIYRNNGDGTFTDVTIESGAAGNEWTSSCVLVDINGDSFPDLFAVNYLNIEDVLSRTCRRDTSSRCAPDQFTPQQDRLYLNLGDGRFEDITQQAGIVDPDGRGLGIVAADFDESHRISLFVGNDMSRNFFFANQTPSRGAAPQFLERGLLQGVAVDSRGIPKASMGIAAGDANGDGRLDLFLTNFYRESNNLYLQNVDHTFSDGSRAANLSEAGVYMLGWGAQFLDGELDGFPDLLVTNGHVHRPSDPAVPFRMPPQYFRNQGNGRFTESSAATLGDYFQGKYLGRSLARLDWNRDGLEEACIGSLDTPVALLTNRTRDHGHFVALKLVGDGSNADGTGTSSRDAIGSTVRVRAGGREWQRQLTAGDGYQASNERKLTFGLGMLAVIDEIEVLWPSGRVQSFGKLNVDTEYVVVEGRSRCFAAAP